MSFKDEVEQVKSGDEVAPEVVEEQPQAHEEPEEVAQEAPAEADEVAEPAEEEAQEPSAEEKERLRKQEEYRERKRREREEKARQDQLQQQAAVATSNVKPAEKVDADELAEFRQIAAQQKFERNLSLAEQELVQLEQPFKEAFDDYDSVVEKAIEFSKVRLVEQGLTESQAAETLRREKVLLADKAAAQGLDPVEAVYSEAKAIMSTFDKFAEKMGYTKGKPKTNLQAAKEMAKPNAFSGGAGKGASASKKTFDDLGDDDMEELDGLTLGAMGL